MNYFDVIISLDSVVITGVDKKGKECIYRDDDILTPTIIPKFLFEVVKKKILPENMVDNFIKEQEKWFKIKEDNFLKNKIVKGKIKISHDLEIKNITDIKINLNLTKKNVKEYSIQKCLEKMTVEQFVDCFGNILQLKAN